MAGPPGHQASMTTIELYSDRWMEVTVKYAMTYSAGRDVIYVTQWRTGDV